MPGYDADKTDNITPKYVVSSLPSVVTVKYTN